VVELAALPMASTAELVEAPPSKVSRPWFPYPRLSEWFRSCQEGSAFGGKVCSGGGGGGGGDDRDSGDSGSGSSDGGGVGGGGSSVVVVVLAAVVVVKVVSSCI